MIQEHIVELNPNKKYNLTITDVNGIVLSSILAENVDQVSLDFEPYLRGMYFIYVKEDLEELTELTCSPLKVIKL